MSAEEYSHPSPSLLLSFSPPVEIKNRHRKSLTKKIVSSTQTHTQNSHTTSLFCRFALSFFSVPSVQRKPRG
jgi:hypothetical protein